MITARLTSSLTPVRPEHLEAPVLTAFSLCRNEPFSFQMAYRITDGSAAANSSFNARSQASRS